GGAGHILEAAVPLVEKEMSLLRRVGVRAEAQRHGAAGGKLRIAGPEEDVAADEEVEPAVAVHVRKSRARAPGGGAEAIEDVGAREARPAGGALVVEQNAAAVAGDDQIGPSVAVIVAAGAPVPAPRQRLEARAGGHVDEALAMLVVIEGNA